MGTLWEHLGVRAAPGYVGCGAESANAVALTGSVSASGVLARVVGSANTGTPYRRTRPIGHVWVYVWLRMALTKEVRAHAGSAAFTKACLSAPPRRVANAGEVTRCASTMSRAMPPALTTSTRPSGTSCFRSKPMRHSYTGNLSTGPAAS